MYISIRDFANRLAEQGELRVISELTDPAEGVAELTGKEASEPEGGKALLFENTGTGYPLLTNVFSSKRRLGMVLDAESAEDVQDRMEQTGHKILQIGEGFRGYWDAILMAKDFSKWNPVVSRSHPSCQDSIQNIAHLSVIPFVKSSARLPQVLSPVLVNSRNPISGARILEPDVMFPIDECTAGIKLSSHGEVAKHLEMCTHRLPLALCLGGDPLFSFIAAAPKIGGIDPYLLAGFFRGKGVVLAHAFTQDLDVPACSDLVVEGYVQKSEERTAEGLVKLHITCITHRRDAVLPAMVDIPDSPEKENVRHAVEKIFVEPLRRTVSQTNEALLLSEEVFYGTH